MSRVIRPELSSKNKYYVSRERYYELKHFCLQYDEWVKETRCLDLRSPSYVEDFSEAYDIRDSTFDKASKLESLNNKIHQVEYAAKLSDQELFNYILLGVTKGIAYPYLLTAYGIPCCRDVYYDRYRKFFWILSMIKD